MNHKLNIHKLEKEMFYHPAWCNDKKILFKLLKQTSFTNTEILQFGRLYTKYSHIHYSRKNELNKYFHFMLQKMQILNDITLFQITNTIYKQKKAKINIR